MRRHVQPGPCDAHLLACLAVIRAPGCPWWRGLSLEALGASPTSHAAGPSGALGPLDSAAPCPRSQDPAGVTCAVAGFLHRPLVSLWREPALRAVSPLRLHSRSWLLSQDLCPWSLSFPPWMGQHFCPLQASSCCLSCVTTPGRLNARLGLGDLLPRWARLLSSKLGLLSHAGHACPSLSDRSVARGPAGA